MIVVVTVASKLFGMQQNIIWEGAMRTTAKLLAVTLFCCGATPFSARAGSCDAAKAAEMLTPKTPHKTTIEIDLGRLIRIEEIFTGDTLFERVNGGAWTIKPPLSPEKIAAEAAKEYRDNVQCKSSGEEETGGVKAIVYIIHAGGLEGRIWISRRDGPPLKKEFKGANGASKLHVFSYDDVPVLKRAAPGSCDAVKAAERAKLKTPHITNVEVGTPGKPSSHTELIVIGNAEYSRVNGGVWTKKSLPGKNAAATDITFFNAQCEKSGEEELDGVETVVYSLRQEIFDQVTTGRYWISSSSGVTVKSEMRAPGGGTAIASNRYGGDIRPPVQSDCAALEAAEKASWKVPRITTAGNSQMRIEKLYSGSHVYTRFGGGEWSELMPGAKITAHSYANATCRKTGEDDLGGIKTTIYSVHEDYGDLRIWISNRDGLIMKREEKLANGMTTSTTIRYGGDIRPPKAPH